MCHCEARSNLVAGNASTASREIAASSTPRDDSGVSARRSAATKTRKFAEAVPDYELIGNTPAAFAEFLRKDAALTARIIAQSGMKAN